MNILNELLDKILSTPEVANQIKKALVNRDLAIEIDGRKYQITTRKPTEDELDKLKAEIWDLRHALSHIIDAHKDSPETISTFIKEAEELLNKRR